jgi:HemY protein
MKRPVPQPRHAAPASGRGRISHRPGWWLALGLILAGIGSAAVAWHGYRHGQHVRAGLPAQPPLAGKPAILQEKLREAQRRTDSRRTMIEGVMELGRLYHANGFAREAEACWRLMQAEQPREARWCYLLADLRRAAGDYDGMRRLLIKTLELAPDYSPARLLLANLQFKSGEIEQAAANYRLRLTARPRDPYARLGLIRVAMQTKQRDEARKLLEDLLKDAPDFSTAHNLYAEILAAEGDAAGAARQRWLGAETLRYADPEDPWLDDLLSQCFDYDRLCICGTRDFQRADHERARTLFERAAGLDPGRTDAYELLSELYLKDGRPAEVRTLLEQALPHLTRKSPVVFINLAQAYRLLQLPAEAGRVLRQGLAQIGDTPELRDALGLVCADLGDHEHAIGMFRSALARNPNDAAMNYHLAVSLLALGRLDETLAALDRSLTLQPEFPPTLVLRGHIEMEAGHWSQAEPYLRRVLASHPENQEARRLLAEWHLHMGSDAEAKNDPTAAEKYYRDGLAVMSDHAGLCLSLGTFYLAHARYPEAVAPLETYLRLQPDSAPACLFLGQAYAASGRKSDARDILTKGLALARQTANARVEAFCQDLLNRL